VSWAWWDWPLTWLINHHPSVLWHCWLGHVTHKTVSEMTYSVSSGTLNFTILTYLLGRYRQITCTFWYIILLPLCGIKLPIFYVYWDNLYRLTALLLGLRVYSLGRTSWSRLDCLQLDIVCECCYFQWLWMTSDLSKPKHRAVSPTPELLVEV